MLGPTLGPFDSNQCLCDFYSFVFNMDTKNKAINIFNIFATTDINTYLHILYRERCEVFFQLLNKRQVPLLIFSAGLGDVIEETIKLQSRMYKNIKIVSNYMDFNHQVSGTLVSYFEINHSQNYIFCACDVNFPASFLHRRHSTYQVSFEL